MIALAGRPNAGKSTFMNQVLGEKVSIVSDKPQTTRNRIMGIYHAENLQVGFIDLPGIHKPKHKMNRVMMQSVSQGLEEADLVFHFIDISAPIGSGDRFVKEFLAKRELPVILVLNKMDLVNKTKSAAVLDKVYQEFQPAELVPISALKGNNIERLLEVGAGYLEEGAKLFEEDALTDQPLRFMAAELIREKILHFTREEIPHACAVAITEFNFEEKDDRYYLSATILAERTAHRRILLGSGGSMITKIRTGARRSLKELLKKPVDLELFVKVAEKWRDRDDMLGVIDFRDISSK